MTTGLPLSQVTRQLGEAGAVPVADMLTLLAKRGLRARPVAASIVREFWPAFSKRHGGRRLRAVAIRTPTAGEKNGHVYLVHGRRVYDPYTGRFTPLSADVLRSVDWLAFLPAVD